MSRETASGGQSPDLKPNKDRAVVNRGKLTKMARNFADLQYRLYTHIACVHDHPGPTQQSDPDSSGVFTRCAHLSVLLVACMGGTHEGDGRGYWSENFA